MDGWERGMDGRDGDGGVVGVGDGRDGWMDWRGGWERVLGRRRGEEC